MSWSYDIGQVCLNGHIINGATRRYPEDNCTFCAKCGEETITVCKNCNAQIRGDSFGEYGSCSMTLPGFCINCGKPFPWTESKLQTAKELVEELEGLNDQEKESMSKSLGDIVRDTPQTTLAATRVMKFATKAGKGTLGALRDILVDIASETAKKILFPS